MFSGIATALVSALFAVGLPISTVGTPAEVPEEDDPAKAKLYLEESFDDADWQETWGFTTGPRNNVERLADGVRGRGITVTFSQGSHFGSEFRWRFSENGFKDPKVLYYRYYLRFESGFPEGTGKLPGPTGIYNSSGFGKRPSTETNPGWSTRMLFREDNAENMTPIGFYTYHLGQEADSGDLMVWEGSPGHLRHDRWYCVEGAVSINDLGEQNGWVRGWVDGEPAFEQEGLEFRRDSEPRIRIRDFWFNNYWGGTTTGPAPDTAAVDFDELMLSSARVGCLTEEEPVECDGRRVTILGTDGNDVLEGTEGRDVIHGLDGDDEILGLGGNDILCGGRGDDLLDGGSGDDRLYGGKDDDELFGGTGRDVLDGGRGRDFLRGGKGRDRLIGGPGPDRLFGGKGSDRCRGENEASC